MGERERSENERSERASERRRRKPRKKNLKKLPIFFSKKPLQGDNDPVDVVEIGQAECAMGSVTPVKPLGVLAMIDDGELDWKVRFF